ncbi:NERD domain-containing protein [Halobacillus sp. HZG1]|nr:NERD domain-containing protein [Halobacillus sp. HZG1]
MLIRGILANPVVKGKIGEAKVSLLLKRLNESEYYVMNDLMLKTEKGTTQIDHVVVSVYGVFVIETKNYKGWIFGDEKCKKWTQVIYKKKHTFMNPIHQNYGHIKGLEEVLGKTYTHPFCSVISFSSKSTLENITITSPMVHVVNTSHLLNTIKMYDERLISNANMKGIIYKLHHHKIEDRQMRENHIIKIKEKHEHRRQLVNGMICPDCGAGLIDRIGKYGAYKGCMNYPECRFTNKSKS